MNSIMAMIGQMMKGGGNSQAILQKITGNSQIAGNPMAMNAVQMFQNGNIDGIKLMAENLAKEKGIKIDDVKNCIMQQFGMQ